MREIINTQIGASVYIPSGTMLTVLEECAGDIYLTDRETITQGFYDEIAGYDRAEGLLFLKYDECLCVPVRHPANRKLQLIIEQEIEEDVDWDELECNWRKELAGMWGE